MLELKKSNTKTSEQIVSFFIPLTICVRFPMSTCFLKALTKKYDCYYIHYEKCFQRCLRIYNFVLFFQPPTIYCLWVTIQLPCCVNALTYSLTPTHKQIQARLCYRCHTDVLTRKGGDTQVFQFYHLTLILKPFRLSQKPILLLCKGSDHFDMLMLPSKQLEFALALI